VGNDSLAKSKMGLGTSRQSVRETKFWVQYNTKEPGIRFTIIIMAERVRKTYFSCGVLSL
jgi:hypothetical protein